MGRTGRFGDRGIALNIVENEHDLQQLLQLEEIYGIKQIEVTMDNFNEVLEKTELA